MRGLSDRELEEFDRATGYVRPLHVDHVGPTGIPPYRPARRRSRSVTPPSKSPFPSPIRPAGLVVNPSDTNQLTSESGIKHFT